MNFQILSCFWGKKHFDLWKRCAFKSLTFEKNRKSLRHSQWNVYTDIEFHEELIGLFTNRMPDCDLKLGDATDLRDYIDLHQSAFIKTIDSCLKMGSRCLLAPPDSIFGDGSVNGMISLGRESNSIVVVPHARVIPKFAEWEYEGINWSNHQLVKRAWEHLHRSWSDAEIGHPMNSSYVGGVEWQKLDQNLYAVTHRLPTPYLIDFMPSDLDYFKMQGSFGNFDHTWGNDYIPQGRMRYCGSSDIAFIAEVTDEDKNIPPIFPNQPKTGFWKNHYQNQINAQIVAVFRGGDV